MRYPRLPNCSFSGAFLFFSLIMAVWFRDLIERHSLWWDFPHAVILLYSSLVWQWGVQIFVVNTEFNHEQLCIVAI